MIAEQLHLHKDDTTIFKFTHRSKSYPILNGIETIAEYSLHSFLPLTSFSHKVNVFLYDSGTRSWQPFLSDDSKGANLYLKRCCFDSKWYIRIKHKGITVLNV